MPSPHTIALMNQKGGVGKTTTVANLGAALAERGRRVLLADLDPQAHLTINYGVEPGDDGPTLYDVLGDGAGVLGAIRRLDGADLGGLDGEVHLLPGSLDLAGLEVELADVEGRQTRLRDALARVRHDYDVILLDCPPSLGLLTVNALAVADRVLIPMQAHFLALQGFAKLLETTKLVGRQINPRLRVLGVVLTMFDSQTRLGADVAADLQGFFDAARGKRLPWSEAELFETRVRRNIKLAEAPSFGQPILTYDSASNGSLDYRNLAAELEALLHIASDDDESPTAQVFRHEPAGLRAASVGSAEKVALSA